VRYLRFFFVEILNCQPEQVGGGNEREPCPGGVVPEDRNRKARIEKPGRNIVTVKGFQEFGDQNRGVNLAPAFIPREQEILSIHVYVERLDPSNQATCHFHNLLLYGTLQ
jgi:hypothetical protein